MHDWTDINTKQDRNVQWIRNYSVYSESMTSHALGELAGSRWMLLHMQQRASSRCHGRRLESMTPYQKSDSVNWYTKISSPTNLKQQRIRIFSARQHICYSALFANARPSVRPSVPLSVTRVDQRRLQLILRNLHHRVAPDSSFLTRNGTLKFEREDRERGRRIRQGYEKYAIFSQ